MSTLLDFRYLYPYIKHDLEKKMVFLGGPRQVGKTTFAQSLFPHSAKTNYFNWDDPLSRDRILKQDWNSKQRLIVLDEIHKYKHWRNFVKGVYDTQKQNHGFLITGSARLDHYRRGGDSLLGRYYYYRMHPLSLPELKFSKGALPALLKFGGFPEPFFSQQERELRRWHLQRLDRLVRDDIRDLERVRDLSLMERLAEVMPNRVGSPLSVKGLSQDLQIDFKTCERWITILEMLYYSYRVSPYGAPKLKAVKKERKLYLWDWSQIENPGARFENLVASHLLKYCHFNEDQEGHKMELRFLRDIEKREVDFVILKAGKPIFAVECKTGEKNLSPHIPYFKARTSIPIFYQVHLGQSEKKPMPGVHILPFEEFCRLEKLP